MDKRIVENDIYSTNISAEGINIQVSENARNHSKLGNKTVFLDKNEVYF